MKHTTLPLPPKSEFDIRGGAGTTKNGVGRPPERINVLIRRRNRDPQFDVEWVEERVTWPKGWPLPDVGSVVMAGPVAGFCDHVEFDLDAQLVLILLR